MSVQHHPFVQFLRQHDDTAWEQLLNRLLPDIHPVDKNATQIWFSFFPYLLLHEYENAPDKTAFTRDLLLQGKFLLADQVDSSHAFLFGYRYWAETKQIVVKLVKETPRPTNLEALIRKVATSTAEYLHTEPSLVLGITAVAFMTLQQVGWETFNHRADTTIPPVPKSPKQLLADREAERADLLNFMRTIDKRYEVCYDETNPHATFQVINQQPMTTASTQVKDNFKKQDPRRVEGPIPIECQTGSCGTCWVGILGGNNHVNEISAFEVKRLAKIGYPYNGQARPIIRLACKAICSGSVTIVIPPWNGQIAPLYRNNQPEQPVAEPATAKMTK